MDIYATYFTRGKCDMEMNKGHKQASLSSSPTTTTNILITSPKNRYILILLKIDELKTKIK